MNKFLCSIRLWVFKWRLRILFRKLAKAEERLRHIETARKYFLPEPLAEMPPPKKTRKPKEAKARGEIPMRITYE